MNRNEEIRAMYEENKQHGSSAFMMRMGDVSYLLSEIEWLKTQVRELLKALEGKPNDVQFDINDEGFLFCIKSAFKQRFGMTMEEFEKMVDKLNADSVAGQWISVKDRLPEVETEVIILAKTKTGHEVITTAMYEDGKMSEDESAWGWIDMEFDYDEENDKYLIPEGWWEYRHYSPDDVYNNIVDDTVTHWMPLPDALNCGAKMDSEANHAKG